jgi:autotransporter-associated beta strand protein
MKFYLGLGFYLVGFLFCALGGASDASAAAKPNVVVIVADDARYSDFGFSAALNHITPFVQTPNIDALAQQGVVGSQFYTTDSLCAPSRAGFLTGLWPQRFGFEDNLANTIAAAGTEGLPANQITIAQRLKSLGYSTGIVGKWHVGFVDGVNRPLDKGFDEFYGLLGGGRDYWTQPTLEQGIWKNNQFYESQYRTEGDHSRYDPVNGRYVTDAFGEEAASFVNRHANDANPFFLYVPFTGPHEPWEAKQSDLDRFANISDPTNRYIAAMTYALDRATGDVLNAIHNNGLDDNTIVVFTNDNGAVSYLGNSPFQGNKGSTYEGGIRVPFAIRGPGLQPGVNNSVMTGLDLLPTIVKAAGGDITQFAHDGKDIMPQLTGQATDDPNEVHAWRVFEAYAIRKGDYKLEIAFAPGSPGPWVHNIRLDPAENVYLTVGQYPTLWADMYRELTKWEVQLEKPKWGAIGAMDRNTFDRFVFRNNLAATTNWSTASAWLEGGTTNIKTMRPDDAYANGIFEFTVRNDASYTANNDMHRITRTTFMLNELRLTGDFNGLAGQQGNLTGNAVLFVKNLSGQLPRIRLDATSSGTSAKFGFQVNNELQLYNDLEITGNGTQNFLINGRICDYYEPLQPSVFSPHNVRKTGSSAVTLAGNNTFTGSLTVAGGEVALSGANAAINGASSISVEDGAKFSLHNGLVKTPALSIQPNGSFVVDGGRLETKTITGNLLINGGTFAPGLSTAISTISNNFTLNAGIVQFEIGGINPGTGFDQLQVGGSASIAGGLQVLFTSGFVPSIYQTFDILTAGNVLGSFVTNTLPTLPNGLSWHVIYSMHGISLAVGPPGQSNSVNPIGDFNLDGVVNSADYTVWRDSVGSTTLFAADANGDHIVDSLDYNIWKAHFGESFSFGNGGAALTNGGVPEPPCVLLAAISAIICKCEDDLARRVRKRSARSIDLSNV